MKKIIYVLMSFFFTINLYGQVNLEEKLTKKVKVVNVRDVALNSSNLFMNYLQENKLDSAKIVLDFWEQNCDFSEPIMRSKIVLEILSSKLTEDIYDDNIEKYIDDFATRIKFSELSNYRDIYEANESYFGYVSLNTDFDKKMIRIVNEIETYDNDLEKLFCLLYSGNIQSFYYNLQHTNYKDYDLRKIYDDNLSLVKNPTSQITGLKEQLTKKTKEVDFRHIASNSANLFIHYLERNKLDSARIVLGFWEQNCDFSEPIMRSKIVLEILDSKLTEDIYDGEILKYVDNFSTRMEFSEFSNYRQNYESNDAYFGYVPLNTDFDQKMINIINVIETYDNDLEELFCLLYSGRVGAFYYKLQQVNYEDYNIRKLYDYKVIELKETVDAHFDLAIRTKVPTKQAEVLGMHPTLGYTFGLKYKRITYDLTLDMRFFRTKESYQVLKSDTLNTNYYFGVYFGADVSYDIVKYKKSELLLLAGFGIDGFDTEFTSSNDDPVVSVYSPNLNGGMMYRWYYNNVNYLGLSYKYNWVNYNSKKIATDLTGNFHSISISFGGLINAVKQEGLKELRYMGKY